MLSYWIFKLRSYTKRLSVRAALFALLAVIASLAAVLFDKFVPADLADLVGGRAVDSILSIMASSMLIVVTFALSTMVAAYASATQNSTPRSATWISEDSNSQNAISIFLGAFIYSIVSLIALSTDYYGEKGRVILLTITVAVLTSVIWVIIKWVDELRNMGRVSETIKRVEKAGLKAIKQRATIPTLGCNSYSTIPVDALSVFTQQVGYVQNIDISGLSDFANERKCEVYIEADVGAFIHLHKPVARIRGLKNPKPEDFEQVASSFAIGDVRTYDSDPIYSFTVLSGVAMRALSPSTNDTGTAIDVIGTMVRILSSWHSEKQKCENRKIKYPQLYARPLSLDELFDEAFYALAQEGSNHLQVVISLQQALEALSQIEDPEYRRIAKRHLHLTTKRAEKNIKIEEDLIKLKRAIPEAISSNRH
jgi:uncharacterized membrane protein